MFLINFGGLNILLESSKSRLIADRSDLRPAVALRTGSHSLEVNIFDRLDLVWTVKTCRLVCRSGRGTNTTLSSRPGLSSAWSIMSGLLVAATTVTPCRPSTPSISVRS